jgi:hypothetical protein
MIWNKHRFTKWTAGNFAITETIEDQGAFRLDVGDAPPQYFDLLDKAKRQAKILNDLAVIRAENERLRTELAALRNGHANSATTLVRATRQPGTVEHLPLPEDFGLQSNGSPWPDEEHGDVPFAAEETILDHADRGPDGRGIPKTPAKGSAPADSPEVQAIAAKLNEVMQKNSNSRQPRIFAEAGAEDAPS